MDGITEVTEEFYGSLSSKKPFNSLEKLEFEDMLEWKQWHALEFPKLESLSIKNCAKLKGKLPENLCSLIEFRVSGCPELSLETPIRLSSLKRFEVVGCPKVGVLFDEAQLFTSQLEGMKKIEELSIEDCNSLICFPLTILPSTLKKITISGCQKLKLEQAVGEMFVKDLAISEKLSVACGGTQITCQLEELWIDDCNSLTSFPFSILPSTLKRITIHGCQRLKLEGPVGEMFLEDLILEDCDCIDDISLDLLPRARYLSVESCHNLTRFLIPTATETLSIWNCENVEKLSVACGNLPSAIMHLNIFECLKLKWLPERMQELLPSLKILYLYKCPEIEHFPEGGLPFNLQKLAIHHCTKLVNSRKEWRLPCLRELEIKHDGSDEDIKHWELPCSIQELTIYNLKTLSSQLLKSLTSLECLDIDGNLPQIQSLLEEGQLPSSLSKLIIRDCPNLQSLSKSALPSSLSVLVIEDCPNLQSLPVSGMPSSLSRLSIHCCPLLAPLLEFDKGEYWPNIAQIPNIFTDHGIM